MKIEKLPSGSYRIRQQYKGQKYTVIVDYKPTQKEALRLMSEKMENASETSQKAIKQTFREYAVKYLSDCEKANYSPATVRGYQSIVNNISERFKNLRFHDIESKDIQKEVDVYAENHSVKSTKNMYGFIRSVIAKYRPSLTVVVNLPKNQKKRLYEPSTKDIERIMEYSKGSRYEIVLRLAAIGLRRGEALLISAADLDEDNVLTINKDLVLDKNNHYVVKNSAKTEASNRRIRIPDALADMIRAHGEPFQGNPHTINEYLHKCQDALGIPRFHLHIIRHFCAAYLVKNGFTSEQVKQYMGWEKSSNIMERVYAYNLDPAESQRDISNSLSNIF